MGPESNSSSTDIQNLPPSPDIRQSLCHTVVAAGFFLINLQNPFSKNAAEDVFHLAVMVVLPLVFFFSWYFFYTRLKAWKKIPVDIRNRITRTPLALKNRAVSHMLMALLAAGLTALGYLGHLFSPPEQTQQLIPNILLAADSLVGILAIAILARTIRDLLTTSRAQANT